MIARNLARLATRTAAAAALAAGVASHAAAQVTATYQGSATGATAFGGYYVGPQKGSVSYTLNGSTQTLGVTLFCVDFMDHITNGQTYNANISYLTSTVNNSANTLSTTRHPNSLVQYREAAWLADQFAAFSSAGDRDTKFGAIQGAIWRIFGTGSTTLTDPTGATGNNTIAYWTTQATSFASSAQYNTYDYSRFGILTDTRVSGTGSARYGDSYAQEFLAVVPTTTTTPEPASIALMGAGLVGLAGTAVRRKQQVARA